MRDYQTPRTIPYAMRRVVVAVFLVVSTLVSMSQASDAESNGPGACFRGQLGGTIDCGGGYVIPLPSPRSTSAPRRPPRCTTRSSSEGARAIHCGAVDVSSRCCISVRPTRSVDTGPQLRSGGDSCHSHLPRRPGSASRSSGTGTSRAGTGCSRDRSRRTGSPVLANDPTTRTAPVHTTELCRHRNAGLPGHERHSCAIALSTTDAPRTPLHHRSRKLPGRLG